MYAIFLYHQKRHYIENAGSGDWFFQENIIQFFLLSMIGYFIYWKNSIGAGDIKLALVLSLFFFSHSSPLIFFGNTAVITLVFIVGYIIGGLIRVINEKELFQEMKLIFSQKYQRIHKIYFSKWLIQMGRKFWKENKETIEIQFSIFLILIGIRFCITKFLIPEMPSLALLGTNTSLILGFYILSPLFYEYIQKYKKDLWWKIWFFIGIIIFLAAQKNLLEDLVSLFFQSLLFLSFFLFIFFSIQKIFSFLFLFSDRKWIPISEIKIGDILNIHATRYFWKNIWKNDQESLETVFSEKIHITPPSFLQKDGDFEIQTSDHVKFWWYVSRIPWFPFPYISIQQTVPYGIFLIMGFLFTIFYDVHLTKIIMDSLRSILHL